MLFEHQNPRIKLAMRLSLTLLVLAGRGVAQQTSGWKLAWSDEFDGPIGAPPDATKWKLQAGAGAAIAGNEEAEIYCARDSAPPCRADQPNAYLDGQGHLVLVAVRTGTTVTVGAKKITSPVYTSARMTSVPSFRYGRIEASIRIPAAGKGVWPAFWALGQEGGGVHWPAVGEIDVMEQWNPQPGAPDRIDGLTIHGAVHGPLNPGSSTGFLDQSADFVFAALPSNGLHQYAVEWTPGEVDFFVDGYLYHRTSVGSMTGKEPTGKEQWEQDRGPFSLLLNLAMGGGFFGYPMPAPAPHRRWSSIMSAYTNQMRRLWLRVGRTQISADHPKLARRFFATASIRSLGAAWASPDASISFSSLINQWLRMAR